MSNLIGRGVRVEVAKTYDTAKTISAITLADPAVASSTGHGLAEGSIGYLTGVTGMANLDGQAISVDAPATDSFSLEGIDSSTYAAFTAGTFVPVTAWSTLARAASYSIGGGDANQLDTTVLLDEIAQNANGLLAAQNVSFSLKLEEVDDEAQKLVYAAALSQGYMVFRITTKNGARRIFRGQPSLFGEDVQQGAIGTGSFSVTVKGQVLRLAAVS